MIIPKSLSAKAREIYAKHDYPVKGESLIKAGSFITNVHVIAGKGVIRNIDDIKRLTKQYPGTPSKTWQKVTGIVDLSNGKKAEVHWYQAPNIGKVEFKVKRWLS